jgi:hypothetical protein
MKAMIDVFNESHPDIRINATTLEVGYALLHEGANRSGDRARRRT